MKPIPATKTIIDVPLKAGGVVRVRRLNEMDATRLITSSAEAQQAESVASLAFVAAAIVGTIGLGELDRVKPKMDAMTRVDMIDDLVLRLVVRDADAFAAALSHAMADIITEDDLPNSDRQDAGSGDAPSGLPQNESAPQAPASSSPPPVPSSENLAPRAQAHSHPMAASTAPVSDGPLRIREASAENSRPGCSQPPTS